METTNKRRLETKRLTLLAVFTALVAILAYLGGFIKIGGLASVSLTLIPVVLGSALCGPAAGAWLGGVAGAVFFATADAAFWLGLSIPGTIITVMVKGIASGYLAGLVYKLIENKNRYLAVMSAAIVCPVVNTGIFLIGCLVFFMDTITEWAGGGNVAHYMIFGLVGANFLVELGVNIIFSPIIVRIIKATERN